MALQVAGDEPVRYDRGACADEARGVHMTVRNYDARSPLMTAGLAFLASALLGACGGNASKDDELSDTGSMGADGGGDDGGGEGTNLDPADWLLRLSFSVEDGELDLSNARVAVTVRAEDGTELCTVSGAPDDMVLLEDEPVEGLLEWWSLTPPSEWGGDCTAEDIPLNDAVVIGVGELHYQAEALVEALGEASEGADETLNGAYVSFDGGDSLLVLGAAGLPAAYAAESGPDLEAPLDDGTWLLVPVYALPF